MHPLDLMNYDIYPSELNSSSKNIYKSSINKIYYKVNYALNLTDNRTSKWIMGIIKNLGLLSVLSLVELI